MGSTPRQPAPPALPPPLAGPIDPAVLERRRRGRRRRGNTQTLLTGPGGLVNRGASISLPTLLGGTSLGTGGTA